MRGLVPVLLLLAACGGESESELSFPAEGLTEVVLQFERGSIVVRNTPDGAESRFVRMQVAERGGDETLPAAERFDVVRGDGRVRVVQRGSDAGLEVDVEVLVPRGLHLDLALRTGSIRISGAFGRVEATTTRGDVTADLESGAGSTIRSTEGDVSLTIDTADVSGNGKCETVHGNATLRIAAGFRGPIQLFSGSAEIDLGPNPGAQFLVDPDKQNARAFAGTPMSREEIEQARAQQTWPAGLWAKTQHGRVTFRVE